MKIKTFITGLLQTNTYLVYDGAFGVLIDPAYDKMAADKIKRFLAENDINLAAILLTHGHFDHVGGCSLFVEKGEEHDAQGKKELQIFIGAEDADLAQKASMQGSLFGVICPDAYPNRLVFNAKGTVEDGGLVNDGEVRASNPATATANEYCTQSTEKPHAPTDDCTQSTDKSHAFAEDCALNDGRCSAICLSDFPARIVVLKTPGHTRGGVCYIIKDNLFSGDTLFRFSIGRTDFEGGNKKEMKKSLELLSSLKTDYAVFPGHGEPTTLSFEKKSNIYMKGQW